MSDLCHEGLGVDVVKGRTGGVRTGLGEAKLEFDELDEGVVDEGEGLRDP